jgi:hypothetical protein
MASTATTILRIEKMANGEKNATWGTATNVNWDITESAIAGTEGISTTGGDTTLTNVDYTNDQAKKRILDVTGTLVSNATIIIPNTSRKYQVFNRTSGAFTLTIKTSSGTGILVTQSTTVEVYCDGSNVVRYASSITDYGTGAPATASGAAASSVSVTPAGNLSSITAQAALAELQGDIDTLNTNILTYQPLDSDLTTIAGLAKTKGNIMVGSGSAWAAEGIGTNGYAFIAKSGATNGVTWAPLIPEASVALWYQAAAPTGWTASDADSNKAIRVVSGASGLGGAAGGTTAFTSVFTSRTIAQANLPNVAPTFTGDALGEHTHRMVANVDGGSGLTTNTQQICKGGAGSDAADYELTGTATAATLGRTDGTSAGTPSGTISSINGGISQTAMDFAVQYISVIKAAKAAY